MTVELILRIILEQPTQGVAYGVQKGATAVHEAVQIQIADSANLQFELKVSAKLNNKNDRVLDGPFVQGKPGERFLYIGIGTFVGQKNSPWSRRLKIPLTGIVEYLPENITQQMMFETHVPGRGKDGTPNCATVKPFEGWTLITGSKK